MSKTYGQPKPLDDAEFEKRTAELGGAPTAEKLSEKASLEAQRRVEDRRADDTRQFAERVAKAERAIRGGDEARRAAMSQSFASGDDDASAPGGDGDAGGGDAGGDATTKAARGGRRKGGRK